jgi:hypothetical protein
MGFKSKQRQLKKSTPFTYFSSLAQEQAFSRLPQILLSSPEELADTLEFIKSEEGAAYHIEYLSELRYDLNRAKEELKQLFLLQKDALSRLNLETSSPIELKAIPSESLSRAEGIACYSQHVRVSERIDLLMLHIKDLECIKAAVLSCYDIEFTDCEFENIIEF